MGCKVGQLKNARDERGWMIPRPGTDRRKVYDLIIAGFTPQQICDALNMTKIKFAVNRHYIMNAEKIHARQRENESFARARAARLTGGLE